MERTLSRKFLVNLLVGGMLCGLLVSCGGSSDGQDGAGSAADTPQDGSGGATAVSLDDAPFKAVLDQAGFKPVFLRDFPSQVPGMKSSILVYRASRGSRGGVLYLQKYGDNDRVVWHWYFDDDAPQSVEAVELNEDGLWDVRMIADGKPLEYVQDESFSFVARQRDDRVAMNGKSSDPINSESMLWHCFDGDTTTAWRSSLRGAFVELPVPLGIEDGILSVQLLAEDQPAKCELKADGKKVQEFELTQTTLEQAIQLDESARDAKLLRLEFKSSHGGAGNVAVSELGVK